MKRILLFLRAQSAFRLSVAALAATGLIGLADYLTGPEVSWSIFYLVPTMALAWALGLRAGILLSMLAAVTWLVANIAAGETYSHPWIGAWNAAVRFGFFFIVVSLIATLQRELQREEELARTDPLTGALNARGFYEQLEREIKRSSRSGRSLTLAYLDVDDFKPVNDRLGHLKGDELLSALIGACRRILRSTDLIGRLGGDEFVIVLSETGADVARTVIEKLRGELSQAVQGGGWPVFFSIGVVTAEQAPGEAETLVQQADELMYEAKRLGKNRTLYRSLK